MRGTVVLGDALQQALENVHHATRASIGRRAQELLAQTDMEQFRSQVSLRRFPTSALERERVTSAADLLRRHPAHLAGTDGISYETATTLRVAAEQMEACTRQQVTIDLTASTDPSITDLLTSVKTVFDLRVQLAGAKADLQCGVADDPSGKDVVDGAEVKFALVGPVLGDIGEPQLVDVIGGGGPRDEVVMVQRAGPFPDLAALLPVHRPPLVVPADPPRRPLTHLLTGLRGFADQEPIAELGVIEMGVQQGVGSVGLQQLGLGDLLVPPAIVGLAEELQDPQGHRDGDAVSGELAHERVELFPGRFAWDR